MSETPATYAEACEEVVRLRKALLEKRLQRLTKKEIVDAVRQMNDENPQPERPSVFKVARERFAPVTDILLFIEIHEDKDGNRDESATVHIRNRRGKKTRSFTARSSDALATLLMTEGQREKYSGVAGA
jgi:hypothetical protein